jgi:peptidoglycan hydrolase-like protein with peptidoglycan-binding domain
VLCEVNATPATIRALQFALAGKGYDPGPRDGRLDPATIDAVHHFQKARGLPQGAVTIETLDALGVPLKPGR